MEKKEIVIAKHFIEATKKILNTMAFLDPVPGKPRVKDDSPAPIDISAIIGVTGACTGSISVSFSKAAAMTVLKGMLGDDIQDPEKDAMDAVGEIINMISGMTRASLAEAGLTMQGSTPSVVAGKELKVVHQNQAPVVVIPFDLGESQFVLEFSLK